MVTSTTSLLFLYWLITAILTRTFVSTDDLASSPRASNECDVYCDVLLRAPVCGSNGHTYQNECYFRQEACWKKRRTDGYVIYKLWDGMCEEMSICPESCSRNNGENIQESIPSKGMVCGSNGITYSNFCKLKQHACQSGRLIEMINNGPCKCDPSCVNSVPVCERAHCNAFPHADCRPEFCTERCEARFFVNDTLVDCTGENPAPSCGSCKMSTGHPVCASDGRTYRNMCRMRMSACYHSNELFRIHDGKCSTQCPTGVPEVTCPIDLCKHATCTQYPSATCHLNTCGRCLALFTFNRKTVDCRKRLVKAGHCPLAMYDSECVTNCHEDGDCSSSKKCCSSSCSQRCVDPITCPSISCPIGCKHGTTNETDAIGCIRCSCLDHPICPQTSCPLDCPDGFHWSEDEEGCRVCACRRCQLQPTCPSACDFGTEMQRSEDNCQHCRCVPPPKCAPITCPVTCNSRPIIEINALGCHVCACAPPTACPPIRCPNSCTGDQFVLSFIGASRCQKCSCMNTVDVTSTATAFTKVKPAPTSIDTANITSHKTSTRQPTSATRYSLRRTCPPVVFCPSTCQPVLDRNNCSVCRCRTQKICVRKFCWKRCRHHGHKRNNDGCKICECCPRRYCIFSFCPDGLQKDEDGCSTCACRPPAPTLRQKKKTCGVTTTQCPLTCNYGYKKDMRGCESCRCCSNKPCLRWPRCPDGFRLDRFGCKTCQCNAHADINVQMEWNGQCRRLGNGNHAYSPNCHHYLSCAAGYGFVMSCTDGFSWNSHRKLCDWRSKVIC